MNVIDAAEAALLTSSVPGVMQNTVIVLVVAGIVGVLLVGNLADIPLMVRFAAICIGKPKLRRCAAAFGLRSSPLPTHHKAIHTSAPKDRVAAFLHLHEHAAQVTTRDVDLMFHMNNARYCREADFARHELFVGCGLFDVCWKRKTPLVTAAQSIRYRRELPFRCRYTILTRVLGWDEGSIFLEQSFCTRHKTPGARWSVHAVLLVKESVATGRRKAHYPCPLTSALRQLGMIGDPSNDSLLPPTKVPPQDVLQWNASLVDASSRCVAEYEEAAAD